MATATLSPIRISTLPRFADSEQAMEDIRDGLLNASASVEIPELVAALRENGDLNPEHPGVTAWERYLDGIIAEVAPQVADLLQAAIQRRLPWSDVPTDA